MVSGTCSCFGKNLVLEDCHKVFDVCVPIVSCWFVPDITSNLCSMVPISTLLLISEEDLNQAAQDCPHHPAYLKNMIIEVEAKKLTGTFPEGTLSSTNDTIRGKVCSANRRKELCVVTWNTVPTSQSTHSFATLMHLGYTCPDHKGSRGASWVSTPVNFGSKHAEGALRPTRTPFQIFTDLAKAGLNPTDPDFLVGEGKTLAQLLNSCLHDSGMFTISFHK
jgi:hypothetical protein